MSRRAARWWHITGQRCIDAVLLTFALVVTVMTMLASCIGRPV